MREDGPDDRSLGDAADGPPSARARDDLRADLRREVADARLRLEEAGLRAETHRLLGDDRAAAEVVAEQQQVVADLERRLGRVVSAAVLQRDAEEVLAGVTTGPEVESPEPAAPDHVPPRRRVPALSGVASAVAVLAVAALAVVGVTDAPSRIEALGAADPARTEPSATASTDRPSQRPLTSAADPTGREDTDATEPGPAATGTVDGATPTTDPVPSPTPETDPTETPTDPSLDQLVAGLTDALRQLGDDVATPADEVTDHDDTDAEESLTGDDPTREPGLFEGRTEAPSDGEQDGFASSAADEPTVEASPAGAAADEPTDADAGVDGGFVSDSAAQ